MNVSLGLAFLGGLVSFFSPCVLPVVPAYFSFLVGTSIEGQISRRVLIMRSLFFVAGFSAIFVLLGASASAAGQLIGSYRGDYHSSRLAGTAERLSAGYSAALLGVRK